MGADYSAHAVVGVRLRPSQFVTKTEKRSPGCSHSFDSGFCPECGAKKEIIRKVTTDALEGEPTFEGMLVTYGTESEFVYIGHCSTHESGTAEEPYSNGGPDDAFAKLTGENVEQIRDDLKSRLEPLGLWDARDFGLWTVLHCSC